MRWRSARIGIDLDEPTQLTLLKTYFNSQHFFPGSRIEIKKTGHGYHFRIFKQHTVQENFDVRRALSDDPMRIFVDEKRIHVGLEDWIDCLFNFKKKAGRKTTCEEECDNILSLPSCSQVPCRKARKNERHKHK